MAEPDSELAACIGRQHGDHATLHVHAIWDNDKKLDVHTCISSIEPIM